MGSCGSCSAAEEVSDELDGPCAPTSSDLMTSTTKRHHEARKSYSMGAFFICACDAEGSTDCVALVSPRAADGKLDSAPQGHPEGSPVGENLNPLVVAVPPGDGVEIT